MLKLIPPKPGRTSFYRIRGTVHIPGTTGSITIDEATGTANRRDADKILAVRQAEILDSLLYPGRVTQSFTDAAVAYVEAKKLSGSQRDVIIGVEKRDGTITPCLVSDFGDRAVNTIDQAAMQRVIDTRYVLTRRGKPYSPATIIREVIQPLTAVLNYSHAQKWCDAPNFERPKVRYRSARHASYEEANRLLNVSAPHFRPIILFCALTGTRESEALDLEWDDVNLTARWVVVHDTKRNGESRGIPLHPQLVEVLSTLPHRTGHVFLTNRGEPYAKPKRGGGRLKTAWAGSRRRAGSAPMRVHDWRHTFNTWLMLAGVVERVREELMGHASQTMNGRYAHVPAPEMIEAVDRLLGLDYREVDPGEWRSRVQPKGKGSRPRRRKDRPIAA
jgi:integrase